MSDREYGGDMWRIYSASGQLEACYPKQADALACLRRCEGAGMRVRIAPPKAPELSAPSASSTKRWQPGSCKECGGGEDGDAHSPWCESHALDLDEEARESAEERRRDSTALPDWDTNGPNDPHHIR